MDSRFLGTLVIIGIISTAIGLVIFSRSAESAYTIVSYDYPKDAVGRGKISTSKEINHITLSMVLDRDASRVTISLANLREADTKLYPITNDDLVGDTLVEKATGTGIIPHMLNMTDFPIDHDWGSQEIEVESGNTTYDLVLFDFSNITLWAPDPETKIPVMHGVMFEANGNLSGYYQGGPGYIGWGNALRSITIRRNSNETKYSMETKGGQPEGTLPMEDAPRLGMIRENDLKKDDIISVDLALDQSKLTQTKYILIFRIDIDGKNREVYITPIIHQY
jgi:hypothetical protein